MKRRKLVEAYATGVLWASYAALQMTLKLIRFYDDLYKAYPPLRKKKKDWFDFRGCL
jgi:hypothetical protein